MTQKQHEYENEYHENIIYKKLAQLDLKIKYIKSKHDQAQKIAQY